MSVFRTAYVYVRNTFAGVLKETDEGYSFRISEAFALHTKVITNRTCILNEPFYDDTRLFVFSEATHIEPEIIKRFLVSPMKPVEESIFSLGTK